MPSRLLLRLFRLLLVFLIVNGLGLLLFGIVYDLDRYGFLLCLVDEFRISRYQCYFVFPFPIENKGFGFAATDGLGYRLALRILNRYFYSFSNALSALEFCGNSFDRIL